MSFRTYGIDLWGFGDSAKVPARYLIDQQVALLERFMDGMGIGRVALVGHGLGALVALLFTQRNPAVVDRLMAVSCPLEENMISPRLRTASPGELADWLLVRMPLADAARVDAPKADPRAIQASFTGLQAAGLGAVNATPSTACLYVHGQNDAAVELPRPEQVAVMPENTHLVVFEQSGHFPMLDDGSKFNRLLTDFLALFSGESPRQLQLKEEWKRRVR